MYINASSGNMHAVSLLAPGIPMLDDLSQPETIEMNGDRTFTTSYRRIALALLIAALLALSTVVAQNQLSSLAGIGSISVAHACQSHTGGC